MFKKCKTDPSSVLWNYYKKLRNSTVNEIKGAKEKYFEYSDKFDDPIQNSAPRSGGN